MCVGGLKGELFRLGQGGKAHSTEPFHGLGPQLNGKESDLNTGTHAFLNGFLLLTGTRAAHAPAAVTFCLGGL